MSWQQILDIIYDEADKDVAERIEKRAREEMGGQRITISKRIVLTKMMIEQISPGKPQQAADKFGVHHSTVYRILNKHRAIR